MSVKVEKPTDHDEWIAACKTRCMQRWDDPPGFEPPCHPSNTGWKPCPLCDGSTERR